MKKWKINLLKWRKNTHKTRKKWKKWEKNEKMAKWKNEKMKKWMKKWKKEKMNKRKNEKMKKWKIGQNLLNQNLNDQVSKNWCIACHLTLIFKLDATVFILLKFVFHF